MTRAEFEGHKTPRIFGTYEAYRRSLPMREWVCSRNPAAG